MTKSRGLRFHHGMKGTKAYRAWCHIRSRCTNLNDAAYVNYGGRGITVCERWQKFATFYSDMGEPAAHLTLERIDNSKGYSPENCRWGTREDQSRNRRNNILVSMDGETHPLSVWASRFGLKYATVHQRVRKYGWAAEKAIKTPLLRQGAQNGVKFHGPHEQAVA